MLFSAAPTDTAAYWLKGRMLSLHYDRSKDLVVNAVQSLSKAGIFGSNENPMKSAVDFYLLNHVSTVISQRKDPLEPLDPAEVDVLRLYATSGAVTAARLFWYILLITTREARHNKSSGAEKMDDVFKVVSKQYPDVEKATVESMFQFTKSCPDSSSILAHMIGGTSQYQLGPFCKLLSALYYKCHWHSSYGGKKWGVIADALHSFVSGEWSAEIFADTAFTLAHNTAPIFNKGMLYSCPSGDFIQLLDCQRAGMVPQWVQQFGTAYHSDPSVKAAKKVCPELFEGAVDWAKVQSLGAVGNYSHMVPKVPPKPPTGTTGQKIQIDHANSVYILSKRAA